MAVWLAVPARFVGAPGAVVSAGAAAIVAETDAAAPRLPAASKARTYKVYVRRRGGQARHGVAGARRTRSSVRGAIGAVVVPAMPMLSVAAVQESGTELYVGVPAVSPVTAEGAVLSAGAANCLRACRASRRL